MMQLSRRKSTVHGTFGLMTIGKTCFQCYTLEPIEPIPAGEYRVILTVSGRAQTGTLWTPDSQDRLPELLKVPGYTAIRIHAGNWVKNTTGCILVGMERDDTAVLSSRLALTKLMENLPDRIIIEEG